MSVPTNTTLPLFSALEALSASWRPVVSCEILWADLSRAFGPRLALPPRGWDGPIVGRRAADPVGGPQNLRGGYDLRQRGPARKKWQSNVREPLVHTLDSLHSRDEMRVPWMIGRLILDEMHNRYWR
jgi:hypothetical protein